jgi:FkbM family methyltransferase
LKRLAKKPSSQFLSALHRALGEANTDPVIAGELARMIRMATMQRHPAGIEDIQGTVELDGSFFAVDLGDRLGVEFAYGLYRELPEALAFIHSLPRGGRMIDVGANFGFFTVRGAQQVGAGGEVLALEPHPRARALLQKNVATNHVQRIVAVFEVGAAEENGRREFHFAAESAFSGLADTGRACITKVSHITVRALDSLAEEHAWDRVHGIKIDVEGFEYAVLEGAMTLLARSPDVVVMMEASPKNLNAERWKRLLAAMDRCAELGLKPWWIDWANGRLRPMVSLAKEMDKAAGTVFLARKSMGGGRRLQAAVRKVIAARNQGRALADLASLATWLRLAMVARSVTMPKVVGSPHDNAAVKRLEARLAALEAESQERLALYRNAEQRLTALRENGARAELRAQHAEHLTKELRTLLAKCEGELAKRAESLKDLTERWTQAQADAAAQKLRAEKAELRAKKLEHSAMELQQLLTKAEAESLKRQESLKDVTERWTQAQAEAVAQKQAAEKAEMRARKADHTSDELRALLGKAQVDMAEKKLRAEKAELRATKLEHTAMELQQLLTKAEAESLKRRENLKDVTERWTQAQAEAAEKKLRAEKAELRAKKLEHTAMELQQLLTKAEAESLKRQESLKDVTERWTQAQAEAAEQKLRAEKAELRAGKSEHTVEELHTLLARCESEFAKRGESLKDLTARWTRAQEEAAERGRRAQDLDSKYMAARKELEAARLAIRRLEKEIVDAAGRIEGLDRTRETLKGELGALETRWNELVARHSELEGKFQSPSALARQWFRQLGATRQPTHD